MTRESTGNVEPHASIVVPVNAQGDLAKVRDLLSDLSRYGGPHVHEVILVVNNYAPEYPPPEISALEEVARVVAIPNVRRPGEAVGFSARIPGVRVASSENVILFDADCRIPNPTQLLDWYVRQFRLGAQAAYTPVHYYELDGAPSVRFAILVHHTARWIKRALFRIPTTRGSNYAVRKDTMLRFYEKGLLADEMNVGPTFKSLAGRVAYSSRRNLRVLTSGRMFQPGWRCLAGYFLYRLRYNLRVLPVREGVARVTGRERDPVRRYQDNRPVTTEQDAQAH